jgi:hypothetical protein
MTALRWSALLTLIGLGLMAWSMLVPTPLPVMLAMTVGQGIGCTAFALYLYVVIRDLRRDMRRAREAEAAGSTVPGPSAEPAPAAAQDGAS